MKLRLPLGYAAKITNVPLISFKETLLIEYRYVRKLLHKLETMTVPAEDFNDWLDLCIALRTPPPSVTIPSRFIKQQGVEDQFGLTVVSAKKFLISYERLNEVLEWAEATPEGSKAREKLIFACKFPEITSL